MIKVRLIWFYTFSNFLIFGSRKLKPLYDHHNCYDSYQDRTYSFYQISFCFKQFFKRDSAKSIDIKVDDLYKHQDKYHHIQPDTKWRNTIYKEWKQSGKNAHAFGFELINPCQNRALELISFAFSLRLNLLPRNIL